MAAVIPFIPAILGVIGTVATVYGQQQAAKTAQQNAALLAARQSAAAEFKARQLEQQAGIAEAASQRDAQDERRKAGLVRSRALALAAASGGGASDPTITNLLSDIEGEGAYRAGLALYQGDERARQLRLNALGSRLTGDWSSQTTLEQGAATASAYRTASYASAIKGGSSLYSKYGFGGPQAGGPMGGSGSGDSSLIGGFDSNYA